MIHSFIEIQKSDLKRKLTKANVRWKYHDKICDAVKQKITYMLPHLISTAIMDVKKEGNHSLKDFYKT